MNFDASSALGIAPTTENVSHVEAINARDGISSLEVGPAIAEHGVARPDPVGEITASPAPSLRPGRSDTRRFTALANERSCALVTSADVGSGNAS